MSRYFCLILFGSRARHGVELCRLLETFQGLEQNFLNGTYRRLVVQYIRQLSTLYVSLEIVSEIEKFSTKKVSKKNSKKNSNIFNNQKTYRIVDNEL